MQQPILLIILISIMVLALGLFIYIQYENRHFHITTYEVSNAKLPKAFEDCTLLFLSDLHNYSYGESNCRLLAAIDKSNPDYVLIGGDMIVKGQEFDSTVALHLIKEIASKYPVYYAMGNHELRISELPETSQSTYVEYVDMLKSYGVKMLIDEHVSLQKDGESINLYGLNLSELYYEKFKKTPLSKDNLITHLGTSDTKKLNILLAHNPVYFPEYSNWGADLVLSGHVHGGMIALPVLGGVMSTQGLLFPKYDFGLFKEKQSTMILSRGLGNHTIHIRFNNRAELIKVILHRN